LALLVVVVWRRSQGKAYWFIAIPMVFMIATTTTSMIQLIKLHLFTEGGSLAIGWINAIMMVMTLMLIGDTTINWRKLGLQGQGQAKTQTETKVEEAVGI
jgi:carbon starvation protein CstA